MLACAGVLPYSLEGNGVRFLLLQNRQGRHWEPPKGVIESGEGTLSAALRELAEETRLMPRNPSELGPPYLLEYACDSRLSKRVFLFPWQVTGAVSCGIHLSSEHDAWRWFSADEATAAGAPSSTCDVLAALTADLVGEPLRRSAAAALRINLIDELQQTARTDPVAGNIGLWLAGSVAADEHTVGGTALMSDVDIVAASEEPGSSPHVAALRAAFSRALHRRFSPSPRVGLTIVGSRHRPAGGDPFWTYFARFAVPLTPQSDKRILPSWSALPSESHHYCLFRLIWYALLPPRARVSVDPDYPFLKSLILLASLGDRRPFVGYRSLRTEVMGEFLYAPASRAHQRAILLEALDVKLGHRLPRTNGAWKARFLDATKSALDDNEWPAAERDLQCLCRYLVALGNDTIASSTEVRMLVATLLGEHAGIAWNQAEVSGDTRTLWWLLVNYRMTRWPERIESSFVEYERYRTELRPGPTLPGIYHDLEAIEKHAGSLGGRS